MFNFLFLLIATLTAWAQNPGISLVEPLIKSIEFSLVEPAGCDANPRCVEVQNNTNFFIAPRVQGAPASIVDDMTGTALTIWDGVRFVSVLKPGQSAWVITAQLKNRFEAQAYAGPAENIGPWPDFLNGTPVWRYGDQFDRTAYSHAGNYYGGLQDATRPSPGSKLVMFKKVN